MTKNAEAFKKANAKSPVIEGHVISLEHGGGQYTLRDGKVFRLSAEECREVGEVRWAYD